MGILLTFDVGTTSMKCCAFDENLQLLAGTTAEYALNTRGAHIVEADPNIYEETMYTQVSGSFLCEAPPESADPKPHKIGANTKVRIIARNGALLREMSGLPPRALLSFGRPGGCEWTLSREEEAAVTAQLDAEIPELTELLAGSLLGKKG